MRGATRNCERMRTESRDFNPRTPCGVRRRRSGKPAKKYSFQSTHPMRGATTVDNGHLMTIPISIHAPHAGCDGKGFSSLLSYTDFNPRTPCGVRQLSLKRCSRRVEFQSTHPMRGATKLRQHHASIKLFQSTHPMRGATYIPHRTATRGLISIHAPHAGCDRHPSLDALGAPEFQSTHPMRGATLRTATPIRQTRAISIHAPHAGCDAAAQTGSTTGGLISIHAPHAGCDRAEQNRHARRGEISIHAPHAGCDPRRGRHNRLGGISIHAPHAGCDRRNYTRIRCARHISIHAPHAGCDNFLVTFSCNS